MQEEVHTKYKNQTCIKYYEKKNKVFRRYFLEDHHLSLFQKLWKSDCKVSKTAQVTYCQKEAYSTGVKSEKA